MKVVRKRGSAPVLELEAHEADLMRNLLDEMKMLLEADLPDDAVRKRLYPAAYQDPDDEKKYRELVGGELEEAKAEAVRQAREALAEPGEVRLKLEPDVLESWLRLLTDLRLAIGTRLDVTEETMGSEIDPTDPDSAALSVLHWLGWVQESILERTDIEGGRSA